MERREFLKIGSAAAAGPALWPAKGFSTAAGNGAPAEEAAPCISVGYLSPESTVGDESPTGSETVGRGVIIQAENLPRGDRELVDRGCQVTVHGLYPSPKAAEQTGLVSLALEVDYEPFQPVSYRAWSYENVLAPNISHPASFHVPVTHEHGLNLKVFLRRAVKGTLAESKHTVRFTPASERGEAKLRTGTYFLGIHANASSREGKWGRYELATFDDETSEGDRWMVHGRPFPGFEPKPVNFPYLVLSIGAGGEEVEETA
jgi:hypothetical protein